MMKRMLAFCLAVLFAATCFAGCGQSTSEDVNTAKNTELAAAEQQPVEVAPEEPPVPEFIGSWKGNARGVDGTNYALLVELHEDGAAVYKCGPAESEIMVDCRGAWSAEGEMIVLSLKDRIEGFAFNGTYKWSTDSGLALTHVSGDAFLYGAEGKTFSFVKE